MPVRAAGRSPTPAAGRVGPTVARPRPPRCRGAVAEALDLGRREPDLLLRAAQRSVVAEGALHPPLLRVGAVDAGGGQPSQGGCRRDGPVGVVEDQPAAEVGHQRRQREGAPQLGELTLFGWWVVRGPTRADERVDEVEVDGRLVVLAAHGRHEQPLGRAGDGDEEEPGLVVAHRGLRRPERSAAAGHDGDQLLRAQQGAAQPQVGPDPFLDRGDGDVAPLAPGRPGRREQRDAVDGLGPRGQRVTGHVLPLDVVEERVGSRRREAVDVALRRVEEGHDGVEVAVGSGAPLPAAQRQPAPPVGHPQGVPHRPQHRLGGHPRSPRGHSGDLDRARCGEPGRDGGGQPAQRGGVVAQGGGVPRFKEDGGQQLVAGPISSRFELLTPKQPPQPAQADGVALPQRREDEVDRAVGRDLVVRLHRGGEDGFDERQQRAHRHLVAHGALASGGQHRHPVRQKDPAQRLVASLTADQDRHLAPGNAVEEVGRAQPRRDVGCLLGR